MKIKFKGLAYLVIFTIILALLPEGWVSAATIDTGATYIIYNVNSNKALDIQGGSTSDNANVIQWLYCNSRTEQWQFIDAGSGYYKIKNVNSGLMMDILGASMNDGANMVQYRDNGANDQLWSLVQDSNGYYKITNKYSGKLLDMSGQALHDGGQAIQWPDNGGYNNQKWNLVKVSASTSVPINWNGMASATSLSVAKHYLFDASVGMRTYRAYIKPREYGNITWKFWDSNTVDTSRDSGSPAYANRSGGSWRIESAYIADGGTSPNGSFVAGTQVQVKFGGYTYKNVNPDEKFWSDAAQLNLPQDHYLVFSWTITPVSSGLCIPYNCEGLATSFVASGNLAGQSSNVSFSNAGKSLVLPGLIAYQKTVSKRIAFIGDSITQGVNTTMDAYENWVAKIAKGFSADVAVWNIGSGWARAYDAASDGAWLYKAKQCDEINICLGVNDIGTSGRNATQILNDLSTTVSRLKANNSSCKVILYTVPPFNFTGTAADTWRSINNTIRTSPPSVVDRVFDIAAVLSQPAPNDNLVQTQYMCSSNDAHPNGTAGTAIANAYLSWYGGVVFYQDINFGGTASPVMVKGNYSSLPSGVPNDWMSSLKVPSGWTVEVYADGGFAGTKWTFTADTPWVGSDCNDKMSSFKIY